MIMDQLTTELITETPKKTIIKVILSRCYIRCLGIVNRKQGQDDAVTLAGSDIAESAELLCAGHHP